MLKVKLRVFHSEKPLSQVRGGVSSVSLAKREDTLSLRLKAFCLPRKNTSSADAEAENTPL